MQASTQLVNTRRNFIQLVAASAFSLASSLRAQSFPSKSLRILVPNAAGGAADLVARLVGEKLGTALGQSVLIDNRPSAGGVVAGEAVARAEADGHTILLISSGTAVSAVLFKTLPFDTLKDFAPLSMLASFDLVLAVNETGRFKSLADLLAYGRANPGKLNIGTPQIGTTQNLAAELFKAAAGIEAQIVPFNGTPPVINALRGGEIDLMIDILSPLLAHINAKALRALAVLGERRAAQLPEVPALREAGGGLANFNVSSWNGLAVPAKTPREVIERLSREVQNVLALPEVVRHLAELNAQARPSTPAQLGEHLAKDMRRWGEVLARAKIPQQ